MYYSHIGIWSRRGHTMCVRRLARKERVATASRCYGFIYRERYKRRVQLYRPKPPSARAATCEYSSLSLPRILFVLMANFIGQILFSDIWVSFLTLGEHCTRCVHVVQSARTAAWHGLARATARVASTPRRGAAESIRSRRSDVMWYRSWYDIRRCY